MKALEISERPKIRAENAGGIGESNRRIQGPICVVTPGPIGFSETFIRAHIERLPHEVVQIHGPGLDFTCDGQKLRQRHSVSNRGVAETFISVLPRFLEFRLRRRFFPAPDDVEIVSGFLRQRGIAVVLAEYGTTGAFMTPACQAARIPLVVHFHGFDASRHGELQEFRERYRRMFDYASRIIAVSRAMGERLCAMGCPAEKIITTPCGPDPSFFEVTPDYESSQILAVGRLIEKKGPHLLLLAFERALQKCPELRLRMLGDGGLRSVCEDLAEALGIRNNVVFEGAVDPGVVRIRMAESFLFVQHSVTARDGDSEGTPVAVVEAGAAGLAVVATRHAGIPDVVISGETGSLVAERDITGMAAGIVALARNRSAAKEMGMAARTHIGRSFTMEKHLRAVNEAIMAAMAESGADFKVKSCD